MRSVKQMKWLQFQQNSPNIKNTSSHTPHFRKNHYFVLCEGWEKCDSLCTVRPLVERISKIHEHAQEAELMTVVRSQELCKSVKLNFLSSGVRMCLLWIRRALQSSSNPALNKPEAPVRLIRLLIYWFHCFTLIKFGMTRCSLLSLWQ